MKHYIEQNSFKLVFIDSDNFHIEKVKGRPVITFLRRLLFTRKIMFYYNWLNKGGHRINFKQI